MPVAVQRESQLCANRRVSTTFPPFSQTTTTPEVYEKNLCALGVWVSKLACATSVMAVAVCSQGGSKGHQRGRTALSLVLLFLFFFFPFAPRSLLVCSALRHLRGAPASGGKVANVFPFLAPPLDAL
jgi:hypothetical protein